MNLTISSPFNSGRRVGRGPGDTPLPKLIDPRPNVALAAKTADIYVRPDGLMYVSDWNAGLRVLEYQG